MFQNLFKQYHLEQKDRTLASPSTPEAMGSILKSTKKKTNKNREAGETFHS